MRIDDFDYDLPDHLIAQEPVTPRDASRLLVAVGEAVEHRHTRDLPHLVGPGDLIVVNDTRVVPGRLRLAKPTGGAVEVLLLEERPDGRWEALVRPSRRVRPGTALDAGDELRVTVGDDLGDGRRLVELEAAGELHDVLARVGEPPLPPYIQTPLDDPERYQTVYARRPGSAAAPTAGMHLTPEVLDRCRAAGAEIRSVELVVGLDTFRPIATERVEDHRMHSEAITVDAAVLDACEAATRVLAVGTTTLRALESAARLGAGPQRTDLFIRRPFDFRVVDLLWTNFHLPRSSLLVLLDAFAGPRWRDLYAAARDEGYRFLSFGDAMLVDRRA